MRKNKVIIGHFGKQHSYKLSNSLKKINSLFKYCTTVYLKKGNLTYFVTNILDEKNKERGLSRRNDFLDNKEVKQFYEVRGLINLILIRLDKNRKIYTFWSRNLAKAFEKRVAKYAIKNNVDAVVMYDTNASICFQILKESRPEIKRILDVSSASHKYMKSIYLDEMRKNPERAEILKKECDYFWEDSFIEYYSKEILLADYLIVPSNFAKESMIYEGVDPKNIYVCPYGVDTEKFKNTINMSGKSNDIIKLVYVGNVTQRKGIEYLLKAIEKFDKKKVSLTIVGRYDNSEGIFDQYMKDIKFTGHLTQNEVAKTLNESDVMVFPSLSDAYPLSVLEALGSGLPVICTKNTGAADIIKDGYNGFVIEAGNQNEIEEKISWFIKNKNKLNEMSLNARSTALENTWEKYNLISGEIFNKILSEK